MKNNLRIYNKYPHLLNFEFASAKYTYKLIRIAYIYNNTKYR